eukprot:6114805-Amphidinium_carterae.2
MVLPEDPQAATEATQEWPAEEEARETEEISLKATVESKPAHRNRGNTAQVVMPAFSLSGDACAKCSVGFANSTEPQASSMPLVGEACRLMQLTVSTGTELDPTGAQQRS